MKNKIKNDIKNESGEVMLEASIIFVLVISLLMALLSLTFLFYQETVIASVATEIAADIAKNYKYEDIEVGSATIKPEDVMSTRMYRTSFGKSGLEKSHQERCEKYADWRVTLTSLGLNPENIDVECDVESTAIGRTYVKVTVSQKTDFFLSGILKLLEIIDEDGVVFSSTAYAECVDFMGYTSTINFTEQISNDLGMFNPIGNLYDSVKNFAKKLEDLVS